MGAGADGAFAHDSEASHDFIQSLSRSPSSTVSANTIVSVAAHVQTPGPQLVDLTARSPSLKEARAREGAVALVHPHTSAC